MKGPWKMLTGKGGREYRDQHRAFDNAIPDYGTDNHPAVSGPLANSLSARNYRRANANHGPLSKWDHAVRDEHQRTHDPEGKRTDTNAGWLARVLRQLGG